MRTDRRARCRRSATPAERCAAGIRGSPAAASRRRRSRWSFAAFLVLLAACRTLDRAELARELLDADRAFAQASLEHGAAEAFRRNLALDSLALWHRAQPILGRDEIVEALAGEGSLAWEPRHAEVAASGDLGWTWGTYTASAASGEVTSRGKYLNVWRRDGGGRWRVAVDIGNHDSDPR